MATAGEPQRLAPPTQAARQIRQLFQATACSIYVCQSPSDQFLLSGTDSDGPPTGLSPGFTVRTDERLRDGTWTGLTSFVARTGETLRLDCIDRPVDAHLDGRPVRVQRDGRSCEIQSPGAFLATAVRRDATVRGVIRLVRRRGEPAFSPHDEVLLAGCAPWVAIGFVHAQARTQLISTLFDIAMTDDEEAMIEKIAVEAIALVHGDSERSGIFLLDQASGLYTFRAPHSARRRLGPTAYGAHSPGLTAHMIRTRSGILSTDLTRDLAPGGALGHVARQPKSDDLTRSFVGVPILGAAADRPVEGVLRVAAPAFNAFSYHDVETLGAFAQQTSLILQHRRKLACRTAELHKEERKFAALIKAAPGPVLAVNRRGRITEFNDAAKAVLGIEAEAAIGHDVVAVVYGGRRELATAAIRAILAAARRGTSLRDYYTVFYRRCPRTREQIPIPVRLSASLLKNESNESIGSIGIFADLRGAASNNAISALRVTEAERPPRANGAPPQEEAWLTVDPAVSAMFERVKRIAQNPGGPVLITGPTGAGKEAIARAVHGYRGHNARAEFIALNCAGLGTDTFESELFGTEPGSFTGALPTARPGLLEEAANGTVFFDEIGELSPVNQAKLLRLLGSHGVYRVRRVAGRERSIKFQVVAATNRNLAQCVCDGTFRADLYERIKAVEIILPPLRSRRADIMLLADRFLLQATAGVAQAPVGFSSDAVRALLAYGWPGNVRELQNTVTTAVQLCLTEGADNVVEMLIDTRHLPVVVVETASTRPDPASGMAPLPPPADVLERLQRLEHEVTTLRKRLARPMPTRQFVERLLEGDETLRDRVRARDKGVYKDIQRLAEQAGVRHQYTHVYEVVKSVMQRRWGTDGHA